MNPRPKMWKLSPTVLLPELERKPRTVLWFKDKYHLSYSDLAEAMGYKGSSKSLVFNVCWEKVPIADAFWDRFLLAVSKKAKEHGQYTTLIVEPGSPWDRLPRRLRIAVAPVKCLGHGDYAILPPGARFCSAECRKLYNNRRKKAK